MGYQRYVAMLVFEAGLTLTAVGAVGCARTARVSYVPMSGEISSLQPSEHVEVLLDRAPGAPHVITGSFFANSVDNPRSITLMREKAAAAGLDGIYWIDCTSTCSGHCSAKGYVYVDRKLPKAAIQVASGK